MSGAAARVSSSGTWLAYVVGSTGQFKSRISF